MGKVAELSIKPRVSPVQIKTVLLDEHTLPLSVFKQLPVKTILDFQSLKLKGNLWGKVQAYWAEATEWLIWEHEGKLYRETWNIPFFINHWQQLDSYYFGQDCIPFMVRERGNQRYHRFRDYPHFGYQYSDEDDRDYIICVAHCEFSAVNSMVKTMTDENILEIPVTAFNRLFRRRVKPNKLDVSDCVESTNRKIARVLKKACRQNSQQHEAFRSARWKLFETAEQLFLVVYGR